MTSTEDDLRRRWTPLKMTPTEDDLQWKAARRAVLGNGMDAGLFFLKLVKWQKTGDRMFFYSYAKSDDGYTRQINKLQVIILINREYK